MIEALVQALLGHEITEVDLKEAYRLDHSDFMSRVYLNSPNRKVLTIRGDFFTRDVSCKNAGSFARTIYATGGHTVALHNNIFVEPDFRRRGIAKAHLSKLLRFYDRCGICYVHMNALDWGPVVWPQFGFDSDHQTIAEVQEVFRTEYEAEAGSPPLLEDVPDRLPMLALAQSPSGVRVGAQALRAYSVKRGNAPIPLTLDLQDETTRTFLTITGILEPPPGREQCRPL